MKKNYILVLAMAFFVSGCGSSSDYKEGTAVDNVTNDSAFQCDGREYCSEMDSFEEAKYFLNNCPNVKMDGDNDGIPCERQFGI